MFLGGTAPGGAVLFVLLDRRLALLFLDLVGLRRIDLLAGRG
jgi:hypothetical protein